VFPLLGLALPEAFHIDVEPVWPVGPPVSEQSVIFDRSTATTAMGPGHARHESLDQSKFPANVDMFPQDAVKSSPAVYATPPDGESQASSETGGVFVMPAWLDPAGAANGSLRTAPTPPPLPLPWLDNMPNVNMPNVNMPSVAPPEPVRPPLKTDALHDWAKPTQTSTDLPANQSNYGASVYSPFVKNGVTTSDSSFEKTQETAADSQPLPPWLQDTAPSRSGEPPARNLDWSVPNLSQHPLDAHNPPASPETPPEPFLAHPMPAFAPPAIVHKTEPQSLRPVIHEEPARLPEPVPHEETSPKSVHDTPYEADPRYDQADPLHQGPEARFGSQIYPFSATDAEPTWHDPPVDMSRPDFVEVNKPHFAAPEIMNSMSAPAPLFPNAAPSSAADLPGPWTGSASKPTDETGKIQAPPAHVGPNHEDRDQLFAALPAVTPPVPPPKPPAPASSRPLADLFRTLGGGGGSNLPRSDGRKEW